MTEKKKNTRLASKPLKREKVKPQKKPNPETRVKKVLLKKQKAQTSPEVKTLAISAIYFSVWSFIMIVFTVLNVYQIYRGFQGSALRESQTIIMRELAYRDMLFNSEPSYIVIPEEMNDKISELQTSVITTEGGNQLTKLTQRLSSELVRLSDADNPIKVRIVSFDDNISVQDPDRWESEAMQRFLQNITLADFTSIGLQEEHETIDVDGERIFRYIEPLYLTETQKSSSSYADNFTNYQIGDLYGAISIDLPLERVISSTKIGYLGVIIGHFIVWLLGSIIIYAFTQQTVNYMSKIRVAEEKIETSLSTTDTQLQEAQTELTSLREKSKSLKEYKSSFLSSISHEIRTPLNGIIGMTELMLRTKVDDSQASMLASIKTSGNALLSVINDIWDFARIEANQIELERNPFPLRDTIFDVVKTLAPQAYAKNLEVNVNISRQIPDILVGDSLRLRQVLHNLIDNAIKFTEEGEINLNVNEITIKENNATLQFSIKDTGIGISLDKQKLIFDELEQEDHSNTRKYSGVGLGLTISHRLVSLMNGSVSLQSEIGRGSNFSFIIELPYLADYSEDSITISATRLQGIEVLVVDDNVTNRKILTEQLSDWGMIPTECSNVDDAMKILTLAAKSITPISIIISDLQMPGKDGIDLAFATKNNQHLAHIPVIILSSGSITSKIPHSLIFSYLTKPTRLSELLKILVRAVDSIDEPDIKPEYIPEQSESSLQRRPLSVLLVEDLEINQIVTTRMLEMLGHKAVIAQNGQQAIEILNRETFDLVLMDIKMPVMDGLDAVRIIRKRERENTLLKHLPVIALTANAHKKEKELYLSEGMDAYLLKPVTIYELTETIDEIAKKFNIYEEIFDNAFASDDEKAQSKKRYENKEEYAKSIEKESTENKEAPIFGSEPCNTFPRLTSKPDSSNADKPKLFSADPSIEPNLAKKALDISMPKASKNQPSIASSTPFTATSKTNIISNQPISKPELSTSQPNLSYTKPSSASTQPSIAKTGPSIAKTQPSMSKPIQSTAMPSIAKSQPSTAAYQTPVQSAKNLVPSSQEYVVKKPKIERVVTPPLDADQIKRSFSSFPDLALKSMEVFIKDIPGLMREIINAHKHQDNSNLKVNAHAIKGLVSYYTKGEIYELALALENQGRDEALPDKADAVQKNIFLLEEELEAIIASMKIYLKNE